MKECGKKRVVTRNLKICNKRLINRAYEIFTMATINGCHVEHQAVTERQKAVF
jgi:hypothetical protein